MAHHFDLDKNWEGEYRKLSMFYDELWAKYYAAKEEISALKADKRNLRFRLDGALDKLQGL